MAALLLAVVEVDWDERVRCQAVGCGRPVHKAVHVIADDGRLLVCGSSCSSEHFGFTKGGGTTGPRYGSGRGRKLTDEERDMLLNNTAALVARLEAEHAAEVARASAAKEAEKAQVARRLAGPARAWDRAARSEAIRTSTGADALQKYRAQQAASAAHAAMKRVPELAQYSVDEVTDAMVEAKERCTSRGLRLGEPGSREVIEAEAAALLRPRGARRQ